MFVINANQSGGATATAYATGGGGNSTLTTASGYYDIPMNGSTYNMFDTPTSLSFCERYDIGTELYQGWNGANPNETSLVKCGKVKEFDQDVLFPNNVLCTGGCRQFTFKTQITGTKAFPEHELDTVVEIDMGTTPKIIPAVVASRKTFNGGEKVGRKIHAYLSLGAISGSYSGCGGITHGYENNTDITHRACSGRTSHVLKCPITGYVDLGLLHEDGTKTILAHKEKNTVYFNCMYIDGTTLKCDKVGDCINESEVYFGDIETEGAIACKGDRTYFEFGVCPACLLYDVYSSTKCSSSCSQNYGKICGMYCPSDGCDWFAGPMSTHFRIYGNTLYGSGGNTCASLGDRSTAKACSTCDTTRFEGIQFSIE